MIFQRYRLPSSNPVPSSLNPPVPYHTFNTPPPCSQLSHPRTTIQHPSNPYFPRPRVLTLPSLVLLFTNHCYDYGYGISSHFERTSPRQSVTVLSVRTPFHTSCTFYHARTLHTFQRFAAAALRPRQFLTNILHLQYYPQYYLVRSCLSLTWN
jgi:hypothetical protein